MFINCLHDKFENTLKTANTNRDYLTPISNYGENHDSSTKIRLIEPMILNKTPVLNGLRDESYGKSVDDNSVFRIIDMDPESSNLIDYEQILIEPSDEQKYKPRMLQTSNDEIPQIKVKRDRFYPWGRKRTVNSPKITSKSRIEPYSTDSFFKRVFNSWAGKRSSDLPESLFKRTFQSWAGKRNLEIKNDGQTELDKKSFQSWAGKRSDIQHNGETEKRKFNSWGGKRSDNGIDKRGFNSWAGKRALYVDQPNLDQKNVDVHYPKRESFNSWLGKRSNGYVTPIKRNVDYNKLISSIYKSMVQSNLNPKRKTSFNAWSGKRSQDSIIENVVPDLQEDDLLNSKRKFSSWGGKRSSITQNSENKRDAFNAWAGKRSLNTLKQSHIIPNKITTDDNIYLDDATDLYGQT